MRLVLIVFIFFLSFFQNLCAQQLVEYKSLDTIHIELKLIKSTEFLQNDINKALRAIAYAQQKPVENLLIEWDLIKSYQVSHQERGGFISEVLIKPLPPNGDFELYDFNSAVYILPQLNSFRLVIYKKDSSLVYLKYFNQNPVSVNTMGQITRFPIIHERWEQGWYMKIDQVEFNYDAAEYSFEQWFQFTNDYKAANFLVEKLLKKYRQLQESPQNPYLFLIKSLRQVNYLKKLYQMPFYLATVSRENDPDKLEQKMKILSTLLDLNIEKYTQICIKSASPATFSIDQLVDAYLLEEENLLVLKQNFGSIYDELFLQLVKTNYPINLTYKSVNFFELLGNNRTPKKMQTLAFENSLYAKSIANIDHLIQTQRFSEALYTIDNLEMLIGYVDAAELSSNFKQYKARAAYGMYYSYVKVVDKAIQVKNSNLAVQYLKKAGLIQETYAQEIITNSLADKKLRQLLDICYADYSQMLNQNMFLEAAAERDTIRRLIQEFQLEGVQAMLDQLNTFDNQILVK